MSYFPHIDNYPYLQQHKQAEAYHQALQSMPERISYALTLYIEEKISFDALKAILCLEEPTGASVQCMVTMPLKWSVRAEALAHVINAWFDHVDAEKFQQLIVTSISDYCNADALYELLPKLREDLRPQWNIFRIQNQYSEQLHLQGGQHAHFALFQEQLKQYFEDPTVTENDRVQAMKRILHGQYVNAANEKPFYEQFFAQYPGLFEQAMQGIVFQEADTLYMTEAANHFQVYMTFLPTVESMPSAHEISQSQAEKYYKPFPYVIWNPQGISTIDKWHALLDRALQEPVVTSAWLKLLCKNHSYHYEWIELLKNAELAIKYAVAVERILYNNTEQLGRHISDDGEFSPYFLETVYHENTDVLLSKILSYAAPDITAASIERTRNIPKTLGLPVHDAAWIYKIPELEHHIKQPLITALDIQDA